MSPRLPATISLPIIAALGLTILGIGGCSFDGRGPGTLASSNFDQGTPSDLGPRPETEEPCRDESCPLGCHAEENRCRLLSPSNFNPKSVYESAVADLELDSEDEVLIDTTSGTIDVDGSLLTQTTELISQLSSGAPPARLLAVNSLLITARTVVKVTGKYPLIIYARDAITIEGTIDASADGAVPGPGGRQGGVGDADAARLDHADLCGWGGRTGGEGEGGHSVMEGFSGLTTDGGGGGGGWGSKGAPGGTGGPCELGIRPAPVVPVAAATAGRGGDPTARDAGYLLSPLTGGCGGGAGGGPDEFGVFSGDPPASNIGGDGGSGGGALQLTAGVRLAIKAGAVISVGGGGGEPGGDWAGGGGGGSGGSLLLESASFEILGVLAANGGGGGAGGPALPQIRAGAGQDGTVSDQPAQGGSVSDLGFGGNGGDGAALTKDSTDGSGGDTKCNAGGGGGGGGRIVIISAKTLGTIPASPAPTTHYDIATW